MNMNDIIGMMQKLVHVAGPVKHLIEAGEPVMKAVHQQAPDLAAAIKDLVTTVAPPEQPKPGAASTSRPAAPRISHDQAAEAVAKAIFTPEHLDQHEKAWMDRASQTSFG